MWVRSISRRSSRIVYPHQTCWTLGLARLIQSWLNTEGLAANWFWLRWFLETFSEPFWRYSYILLRWSHSSGISQCCTDLDWTRSVIKSLICRCREEWRSLLQNNFDWYPLCFFNFQSLCKRWTSPVHSANSWFWPETSPLRTSCSISEKVICSYLLLKWCE